MNRCDKRHTLQSSLGPNLIWVPESPAPPFPTVPSRLGSALHAFSWPYFPNRLFPQKDKTCSRRSATAEAMNKNDYEHEHQPTPRLRLGRRALIRNENCSAA